ncbi:MAG: glycosyltransferase family 4 protein [Smithella sp.]|nr:glycosyltransferase family 4 protein [Smithella sp.]
MGLRITYIARSFLDYRIPVFDELSKLIDGNLTVIFSEAAVPDRVVKRVQKVLGDRAVGLSGERVIGFRGNVTSEFANTRIRIPWQPRILKEIKKSKPDVLIGDGFAQWTLAALVYRILHDTPFVMCYERTCHTERNAQWYRTSFRKAIIPLISATCVNGSLSKTYAASLGIPENLITTGHMVADTDGFDNAVRSISQQEKEAVCQRFNVHGMLYLYVGRLIPLKGLAQLINGWALFEKESNEGTLLLVGGGPEEEKLKAQVLQLGLKNVAFAGSVDYNDIAPFYASGDVFVMPTLEDNWSLVVPEAMACGLPIICSKYNGCWPELVHEEKNGWVFDPLNIEDTVRVLRAAIKNKSKLSEMGQYSKEIVEQHTPRAAAQVILSACKTALNRKCLT